MDKSKINEGLTETIAKQLDELSIDDVLRCLINDSDIEEVVCCLDFIAHEDGMNVEMYKNGVREYPAS